MPTIVQTFQGRVTGIWGTAQMRGKDGKMHLLKLGDLVHQGDVILTTQNGIVQLSPEDSTTAQATMAHAAQSTPPDIDRVISALNEPDSQAATAAGVSGGDGAGDLSPGLRVDRISESVTPTGLTLPTANDATLRAGVVGGLTTVEPPHATITAGSNVIDAVEEGPSVNLGLTAPTGTSTAATITVTEIPLIGQLQRSDGTPVTVSTVLTPAELSGLKYMPPADYDGKSPVGEVAYTVTDGGHTATGIVGILLAPVDDAPVAVADTGSTLEDTPITGNVLSNDHDVDSSALQVTQYTIAGVTHAAGAATAIAGVGTLVLSADGSYTFTPVADYFGPVPAIGYTLSDGTLTSSSTLTLAVTPVNDAPDASDDIASTLINVPVTIAVLANDHDRDGDALTVTGATLANPAQGTLVVNPDGTLAFTPATNVAGPVTISYTVSDGHGGSDTASVTVNVGANTPPTGADGTHTLTEDASYTVAVTDFGFADADLGQTLANVRIDSLPTTGSLMLDGVAVTAGTVVSAADVAAGKLVFVPVADGNGTPYTHFTFSVQDSAGAFDTAPNTLTLNVAPVNDAPVAVADSSTADEDTTQTGNLLSNDTDVDGDTLSVTQFVVGGTTHAAGTTATLTGVGTLLIEANGSYTFTPAADYNGPVPVATYTVSDGTATTTSTLTLGVTAVADVVGDTVAVTEDTPITFNPISGLNETSGADNFEGSPVLTAVGTPAHGTVSFAANGAITYTPDADYNGPDSFTYTVTSGGVAETATISVNVAAVNDAPAHTVPVAQTTDEDTSKTITGVSVADVDSSSLTTTLTVAHGTLGVVAGGGATIAGNGSDTVTISGTAAQINAAVAAITYVPVADYNGGDSMSVSTSDGSATTNSSVALTVAAVADIVADSVATSEDTVVSFNPITGLNEVGGADNFDSAGRVLTAVGSPSHGVVTFAADGTITYTPDANYNGADSFQYTVTSGGVTETATITVNVAPVNDAPTLAVPAAQTTLEDSSKLIVGITVADVDGDLLTTTLAVTHGTLTTSAGSGATVAGDGSSTVTLSGTAAQINAALAALTYAPQADYNGSDTVVVSTSDGTATTSASVAIGVTAVADIVSDTVAATEDTPITFNPISGLNEVAGADSFEGAPVLSAVGSPAHGAVSFAADGTITYTPVANYHGTDTFSYTITSGGVTETATITVNVASVNDAPVVAPDANTGLEDAIQSGNVLSNDSDADGDVLSVTQFVVGGVAHAAGSTATLAGVGTLVIGSDGTYTFTPVADYNGPVPVATYTVSDGTVTTTADLTLTVTPVADIAADAVAVVEDTPITFNPITGLNETSGADNFENAGHTLTAVGTPSHGSVVFAADGTITYTPIANYNGSDSFTYTVTSGGVTETATITVNVAAVNDAPVNAVPAAQTTTEDTSKTIVGVSVTDVDSASLTTTLTVAHGTLGVITGGGATIAGNGSGTVTISGTPAQINAAVAAITYVPVADFNGSDSMSVSTSDGAATTNSSVALTVTAVADVVNDVVAATEDTVITFNPITGLNETSGADNFESAGRVLTAVGTPAHGTVSFTAAGAITYTPTANYNGSDSFTYTVTSGGVTETATITVNVAAVNDAPVVTLPAAQTTAEDTTKVITGVSVTDVDSASLTTTLTVAHGTLAVVTGSGATIASNGSATVTISGTAAQINAALASITYKPTADFNGSDALGVATSDGSLTTSSTVAITVTAVADVVNDVVTATEDTVVTFNPITGLNETSGADNFENAGRTLTAVGTPSHGTVSFTAAGAITYTPTANYNGSDSFTYTVTSGGVTETATITVNVAAVNDAPVNTIAALSTNEDTALKLSGLSIADVDAASGAMSVTLKVASGTIAAAASGGVSVTGSGSTTVVLTGTLTDINAFLAASASQPVFTPVANANGSVNLTMTTSDLGNTGSGGTKTDVDTVAITVVAVNDAPVNTIVALSTNEDTTLKLSGLKIADVDASTGTMSITLNVASGTIAATSSGTITVAGSGTGTVILTGTLANLNTYLAAAASQPVYTPVANANGTVALTMTTSDNGNTGLGGALTDTDTVNITVNAVNDAPVNTIAALSTNEDTALKLSGLSIADVDAASGAMSVTLKVASGTIAAAASGGVSVSGSGSTTVVLTGTLTDINAFLAASASQPVFTPVANANGSVNLTMTTSDQGNTGSGGTKTDVDTVAITVIPVNDAPVNTVPAAQATTEDSTKVITGVKVADVDSASLTTTLTVAHGTLAVVTGGGATIASNGSATVTISGTVAQINTALASITYKPTADFNGSDSMSVSTSDGAATTNSSVALTVTAVADIVNDVVAATEDTVVTFNPITGLSETSGADNFENAGRILTAVGTPSHGTVTFTAAGAITYTPTANYSGSDSFTYTVTSGGVTETATITVNVAAVNDAPINTLPVAQTTNEDTSKVITGVSVADVDSASLTTTLTVAHGTLGVVTGGGGTIAGNGSGTVTISGTAAQINAAVASITYTPVADFNGSDSLGVATSDGSLTTSSSVALTVTAVADVVNDVVAATEDTVITFNPITGLNETSGADNFESAGRVLTAVGTPAHGTVSFTAAGAITYTPTANYNGSDSFTYTVTSGGVTETATITVNVTPVNDATVPTLSVATVERWAFDEASGSSTTDAYNAQTGTLSDSTPSPATLPTWTTGHTGTSGTALHFDGAGSYVALAATTTAPLLGTSSLSFWIKTAQTGNAAGWDSPAVIASEQSGSTNDIQWGVLNASGKIGFDVGNAAGVYSTTSVNDNAWHQVAITRDASTSLVSVYIDGVLEATGSPTDAGFTATLNKLTGFGATNNFLNDAASTDLTDNRFLNADLDDVRIYNHVLTADQVAAIRSVESGYHDVAVANDGDAIKLALTATDYTALSVSGLNTGMVISDGAGGHTTTIGATGTDTVVDLTGWTLGGLSISGAGSGSATLAFHATDTVSGESQSTTEYLNIVNGTSLLAGTSGNDSLTGTANADLLIGNAGNDTLNGATGNDRLLGGAGDDTLIGGSGNDILYGGAGNDTLTGGAGADVFAWTLTDRGSSGTPAKDVISDFDVASVASGGDTIDLRDLLVGANHVGTDAGNLTKYLDFDTTTTPGSTTIHVSSSGGFTGGVYTAGNEDQTITLQNVDLRASFGLAASSTDSQIINELLTRGKLVTDGH